MGRVNCTRQHNQHQNKKKIKIYWYVYESRVNAITFNHACHALFVKRYLFGVRSLVVDDGKKNAFCSLYRNRPWQMGVPKRDVAQKVKSSTIIYYCYYHPHREFLRGKKSLLIAFDTKIVLERARQQWFCAIRRKWPHDWIREGGRWLSEECRWMCGVTKKVNQRFLCSEHFPKTALNHSCESLKAFSLSLKREKY